MRTWHKWLLAGVALTLLYVATSWLYSRAEFYCPTGTQSSYGQCVAPNDAVKPRSLVAVLLPFAPMTLALVGAALAWLLRARVSVTRSLAATTVGVFATVAAGVALFGFPA